MFETTVMTLLDMPEVMVDKARIVAGGHGGDCAAQHGDGGGRAGGWKLRSSAITSPAHPARKMS